MSPKHARSFFKLNLNHILNSNLQSVRPSPAAMPAPAASSPPRTAVLITGAIPKN
jgi:hypothetical protein